MTENKRVVFHPNKLVLSFFVTMLAFVTLTASTLAWLSVAREVYVDEITMGVISTSVLEISLDGENYYSEITTEQLNTIFKENFRFVLVTTDDNENFYHLDEGTGAQKATPNVEYISFTLYFRTSDVYLENLFLSNNIGLVNSYDAITSMINSGKNPRGTFVVSKGVNWSNPITFDNGGDVPLVKGSVDTYYLSETVRIGMKEQNVDIPFLLEPDERLTLEQFIYDVSENEIRGFGKSYGAVEYYQLVKNRMLNVPPTPETIYQLSTFKNPYQARNADSKIATFQLGIQDSKMYGYAKVHINIWLEGWDADAFDAVIRDTLLMQLNFQCANLT